MNLTFGICWIEDQASGAEVDAVKAAVRGCGFEPELKQIAREDEIREFARQQEHFQDYDLILLDLRLGRDLRGDALAPEVRNRFRSTPILFYSAESEQKLRQMMADKYIEGAFCTHRDRLSTRVGELVSDLSPALNRLSGMRGLAARVVAECDQELRSVLLDWGREPDLEALLVESIKDRIREASDRQVGETARIEGLGELLEHRASSSSVLFREVYARLGEMRMCDDLRATRRELRQYPERVLAIRNTLAHALEERTDNGWRISRREPNPDLTRGDFEGFRADFLIHLHQVRRLRGLLIGEEPE